MSERQLEDVSRRLTAQKKHTGDWERSHDRYVLTWGSSSEIHEGLGAEGIIDR